jgi:hypothetical protein
MKRCPCKRANSGVTITKVSRGASIHAIHLSVCPGSFGTETGGEGESSFCRQQHARDSDVTPQQHGLTLGQQPADRLAPTSAAQTRTAPALEANPLPTIVATRSSAMANSRLLQRLNMT